MATLNIPTPRPAVAVCVALHVRQADDELGMAWWNHMTEPQRAEACRRANTDCPAEAWAWWKTHTARPQPAIDCFAIRLAGRWIGVTRNGPDEYRSQVGHRTRTEALLDARRVATLLTRGDA